MTTKEKLLALAKSLHDESNPDRYYPWLTLVTTEVKPKVAVEIGTALGEGAYHIAQGLPEDGKVYTIDVNPSLFLDKFHHNKIVRVIGDSKNTPLISDIDLLFIDGHHDQFTVTHDYRRWSPQVKSGGVIVFDDVNMPTVAAFLKEEKVKYCDVSWLHSYHDTGFGFLIK